MKGLVGMVVSGLVVWGVVALVPRSEVPAEAAAVAAAPERPWLDHAVADEIVGPGGTLGPLFTGVTLGGAPPPAEVRDHIAAFAREHDVAIDFEIVDDELVAIRFDVTFGGCCGYEGAEALANRIGRPKHLGGCGDPTYYYDNWALAHEDGTHVDGTVRVNRFSLRWERAIAVDEMLSRAEQLLGAERGTISAAAGDRWLELETGKRYLLELPYSFVNHSWQPARSRPADRGLTITTDRRIVTDVMFETSADRKLLKKRWGTPRVVGEGSWLWYRGDRAITADFVDERTTVTIARR